MVNLMTTVQLLTELQTDSADTDSGADTAVLADSAETMVLCGSL